MQFTNPALSKNALPDPLWLYKASTSLMHKEAESRAATSGRTVEEEASVLLSHLEDALTTSNGLTALEKALKQDARTLQSRRGFIGVEPLIKTICDEAAALHEAFGIKVSELHAEVARSFLNAYSDIAGLVHMERAGKISTEELRFGALLKMKDLNRYGANGLSGFWNVFDSEKSPLLEQLKSNPKSFTPKWIKGAENSSGHSLTRAKYFASEYEHAAPKTQAEFDAFITKFMPELIGSEYHEAVAAKEQLLARHIKSGKAIWGDNVFVQASAIHRNNEYLQGKAIKHADTREFEYIDSTLNPTEEMLARIREGEFPETFLERHDAAFDALHPNQDKIAKDLRATISHTAGKGAEGVSALESEKAAKPQTPKQRAVPSGAAEGASKAAKEAGKFTNARVGATGLFGIALVDGLMHLRSKDAPDSLQDKDESTQPIRFSRVAEVAIGASGIAAAWLLKDKEIAKLLNKAPNKSI